MHPVSALSQVGPSSGPHTVADLINEPIVIDLDGSPPLPTILPSPGNVSASLLSELEHISGSVPLSTPEGMELDILSCFSGNPVSELEAGQDPWEMVDRALNGAIGYDKTVEDITKIIQRGPRGMDGL